MTTSNAPRRRLTSVLGKLGLVVAAFAGGVVTSNLATATPEGESPYLPFDQMSRVILLVEHNYVEPAQREKLLDGAMRGLVAELDPHSSYMNQEEFSEFTSDTEGRFAGIGVEVDLRDEQITVIAPIDGSPAARAGVKAGDRILAVDGRPLRGAKLDRIVDVMRGAAGTKVTITVGRTGATDPIDFTLVREIVQVASIEAKRLDKGVLYIRLKQFQETSHEELLRAIARVRKESSEPFSGVLLDMRYNPGGLVDQAELIADEFLSKGVIYSTRHRGKVLDQVEASAGGALVGPKTVVLVNEYSASAAELVAGALQDQERCTVVGNPTFGKGSVQTIFELPGGSGLRLTTMRYYTPNGRAIQAHGIDPDILIRPAKTSTIIREQDLRGHLSAEKSGAARPGQIVLQEPESDALPTLRLSDIPADPTKGKDFALATAFETLVK